jgi:hypothetical protein
MPEERKFQIELLDPGKHRREQFSCESRELTEFLKTRARKEMEAKTSVCFVVVPVSDPARIAGYYTLSAASLLASELPQQLIRKLPRYPQIPATLLGRLARDSAFKGSGIGSLLLRDAMARSLLHSTEVASVFLVVDAKDERVATFYKGFGFEPLREGRMLLPMIEVKKWLG